MTPQTIHNRTLPALLALLCTAPLWASACDGAEETQPPPAAPEQPEPDPEPEPATPPPPEPVPEVRPGILQGFLATEELPNSLALVPEPPQEGSVALARDRDVAETTVAQRSEARFALAASDADLSFPHAAGVFSCALGVSVSEGEAPHLYQLLRRTLADAGLSTYAAKNTYNRARPFMVNGHPTCSPGDEEELRHDGSYPSGHTSVGWAWALILAELAPDRADAILARGLAFGDSRVVCNVHWQSDVDQGRIMAAAAVARLHGDEDFEAELAIAERELSALRANEGAPPASCATEARALATEDATEGGT